MSTEAEKVFDLALALATLISEAVSDAEKYGPFSTECASKMAVLQRTNKEAFEMACDEIAARMMKG